MYIGTHYNGYYNSLFGNKGSIYSSFSKAKVSNAYANGSNNLYNSASLKYVQDLKSGSAKLSAAISALSSGAAFAQKTAVSSNTELMTVKSASNYSLGNKSLAVIIDQTATGQTNTGNALAAKAQSTVSGYQQFSIEINDRNYQFSINVGSSDSNKDVQQKMAEAINARGMGIVATVVADTTAGTSALKISAQSTGDNAKSKFHIQDVYGNLVQQTGVNQVTQEAQNAVYRVDGGEKRSSQSNTVDLGSGVTATLLKASDDQVTVSKSVDTKYALDKVQDMINSYNQLYGAALNNNNDKKANNLFSQLVNASRTYGSSLAKIGISFDSNGYMQADSDKLTKAAQDGSLEHFFATSANYGYGNQLGKIAGNVSNNTSRYVSQSNLASDLQSSLYNFYDNNFFNTYQSYLNTNNTFNSGLLFDLFL